MSDRIHAYLDGDLPLDDLSPAERAALAEMEDTLGAVVGHLRALPTPDLTAAVMRSLPPQQAPAVAARAEPAPWRRLLEWLWSPHPVSFTFRPAYALTGAMLAAFAVVQVPRLPAPAAPPVAVREAPPAPAAPTMYVHFRLEAPQAHQVALAGTFTGWEPRDVLRETEPGVWTALVPLRPGVHDYAFVVDGEEWVTDPAATQVEDSFGGTNSRISLPPPGSA
ncbi:MAG TPA: glycogen-binding domain-containing protein [Longimicrobiaceae bacterium]|nr:glycogen-binding domain-containing protein [Longimicrobiaceae bacterium]